MRRRAIGSWLTVAAIAGVTILSTWLTVAKLRVSTDLSSLFPGSGDAAALSRWNRAFSGRDPVLLLVSGRSPEDVERVADDVADALRHAPSIERVIDRAPAAPPPPDPTLAWALSAGARASR